MYLLSAINRHFKRRNCKKIISILQTKCNNRMFTYVVVVRLNVGGSGSILDRSRSVRSRSRSRLVHHRSNRLIGNRSWPVDNTSRLSSRSGFIDDRGRFDDDWGGLGTVYNRGGAGAVLKRGGSVVDLGRGGVDETCGPGLLEVSPPVDGHVVGGLAELEEHGEVGRHVGQATQGRHQQLEYNIDKYTG